jgi:hypothetical protein
MSVFEALTLMLAFAVFVVMLLSYIKNHKK